MLRIFLATLFTSSIGITVSASSLAQDKPVKTQDIIALERAALDRWVVGDTQGYLDLYAPEVTYFDPYRERRVDGLEAMKAAFAPPEGAEPSAAAPHYELIEPKIQGHEDLVVLTFNFVSTGGADAQSAPESGWNATEVYGLIDGEWKIIHSHWSRTTPEMEP
jgi:ketosteroid isomerase-like protein